MSLLLPVCAAAQCRMVETNQQTAFHASFSSNSQILAQTKVLEVSRGTSVVSLQPFTHHHLSPITYHN